MASPDNVLQSPTNPDVPVAQMSPTLSSSARLSRIKEKVTTKAGWFGGYDYSWLCLPTMPFLRSYHTRSPPFYALDADMPLILAAASGLQHALAMLAGKRAMFMYSPGAEIFIRLDHASHHLC